MLSPNKENQREKNMKNETGILYGIAVCYTEVEVCCAVCSPQRNSTSQDQTDATTTQLNAQDLTLKRKCLLAKQVLRQPGCGPVAATLKKSVGKKGLWVVRGLHPEDLCFLQTLCYFIVVILYCGTTI